jgi:hypothetical protein
MPVEHELIPTEIYEDYFKIENRRYKIIDAQERVIGPIMKKEQVFMQLIKKKDSRILYDVGSMVRSAKSENNCVEELLKLNKADPNLVSQIFVGSEAEGLTTSRVKSEEIKELPSFEQIMNWKSYK